MTLLYCMGQERTGELSGFKKTQGESSGYAQTDGSGNVREMNSLDTSNT